MCYNCGYEHDIWKQVILSLELDFAKHYLCNPREGLKVSKPVFVYKMNKRASSLQSIQMIKLHRIYRWPWGKS